MRTFQVFRKNAPASYAAAGTANPPGEPQFQGAVFDDGTVAVRWLTAFHSTSLWENLEALEAVHGHPEYETEWRWSGDDPGLTAAPFRLIRDILEALCRRSGLPLDSAVEPGRPARNYELAGRLGIGQLFGLPGEPESAAADRLTAYTEELGLYGS